MPNGKPKPKANMVPKPKPAPYYGLFHCGCGELGKKLIYTLFGILLVYIIVLVGTVIRNNLQEYYYIGQAEKSERTITVDAQGKVTANPDIAVTTIGMISEAETVIEAQQKNTAVMNDLIAKLKELGIEEDDLQTANYNIYPLYDYLEDEGRVLKGYEVRQSVEVKIRDLEKANQVLTLAGEAGANNVSGLEFTIDDDEVYKAQAREEALKKAAEKAGVLSKALGVRLVKIVSYDEYAGSDSYPYRGFSEAAMGLGGGGAPEIEAGSMEVIMNVSVTFEIR